MKVLKRCRKSLLVKHWKNGNDSHYEHIKQNKHSLLFVDRSDKSISIISWSRNTTTCLKEMYSTYESKKYPSDRYFYQLFLCIANWTWRHDNITQGLFNLKGGSVGFVSAVCKCTRLIVDVESHVPGWQKYWHFVLVTIPEQRQSERIRKSRSLFLSVSILFRLFLVISSSAMRDIHWFSFGVPVLKM